MYEDKDSASSPLKFWNVAIPAALSLFGANRQRKESRRQSNQALEYQTEQDALLEEQKQAYRDITFTNPYEGVENAYGGLQTDFSNIYAGAENVYAGAENVAAGAKNVYAGAQNAYAGARNTFAGMDNAYANLENKYEGMENRFEDMTVDTRAAEFQAQQGGQQRANILQGLRGAAGTSGVAGLAQAMAGQGQLQAQQISAGIGQQERQNKMLSAQEGSRIDQMQRGAGMQLQQLQAGGAMSVQQAERAGAMQQQQMQMSGAAQQQQMILGGAAQQQQQQLAGAQAQQQMILGGASEQQRMVLAGEAQARAQGIDRENLVAQGAYQADMAERGGDAMLQEAEMSRQATLLGMQYGQTSGANLGYQQSQLNQQQSSAYGNQMMIQGLSGLAGTDFSNIPNPFANDFGVGDSFF